MTDIHILIKAKSINRIPGCRPCVLNGQSNRDALLDQIRTGEYTHGKDVQSTIACIIS